MTFQEIRLVTSGQWMRLNRLIKFLSKWQSPVAKKHRPFQTAYEDRLVTSGQWMRLDGFIKHELRDISAVIVNSVSADNSVTVMRLDRVTRYLSCYCEFCISRQFSNCNQKDKAGDIKHIEIKKEERLKESNENETYEDDHIPIYKLASLKRIQKKGLQPYTLGSVISWPFL